MRRISISMLLIAAALALGGCVGDTDPATKVTDVSAQLNAHGYTDDGPATWWWEHSTRDDVFDLPPEWREQLVTEVCGSGTGPKEPDNRCGPATGGSASNPVSLNVVLTGLEPSTTYYFRACGQDQGEGPSCGNVRSFTTLAGARYGFDRKWGSFGTANGQFKNPSGIALDQAGNVYVADTNNNRIQKFGPSGNLITKWGRNGGDGSSGSGDGQFKSPAGVATYGSNVYVADTGNNRIQKFSLSGSFVTKWGSSGPGDGQFNSPQGVSSDGSNVYVADTGNNRIQKFSQSGSFVTKWSSPGSGDGQFNTPRGIASRPFAASVADTGNHRLPAYNETGGLIGTLGNFGSGDGQFNQPRGIAGGPRSYFYVADTGNHRIQKFNLVGGGSFVTKWGSSGTGDGQFNQPAGVAADGYGYVYVADSGNHRIQKFKPVQ